MGKRTYYTEFKDFTLDVSIPRHWQDESWHNDVCPSWLMTPERKEDEQLRVFVDYALEKDREVPGDPRFSVLLGEPGSSKLVFATDHWQRVLDFDATVRECEP